MMAVTCEEEQVWLSAGEVKTRQHRPSPKTGGSRVDQLLESDSRIEPVDRISMRAGEGVRQVRALHVCVAVRHGSVTVGTPSRVSCS